MANHGVRRIMQQVRQCADRSERKNRTDAALLASWCCHREEEAFQEMVRRHGPMVFAVCRQRLGNLHDAEDAYQATFLLLARKGHTIRQNRSLGGWLFRVAFRVSLTAIRRRRASLTIPPDLPSTHSTNGCSVETNEIAGILLEEVHGLPKRFRSAIILCCLEQQTLEEVAQALACPVGTVASRLARGRERLLRRLARRGITLSMAGLFVGLEAVGQPNSPLPNLSNLETVSLSANVQALTQGALKTMMWMKARSALMVLGVLASTFIGGTVLWNQFHANASETPSAPVREVPAEKAKGPAVVPVLGSEWPLFRGNPEQSGALDVKLPEKFKLLWKFSTKDSVDNAVAIVKGTVYAGSYDEHLYAIDLQKGEQKWKTKLGTIKASPCVKGGKVYVGDIEGTFYCLDAEKGDILWKFKTEGEIASGCNFVDGHILIGSHDETLYCLNEKGEKVWEFKTQGPVNGSPAVAKGKTFVAGCDSDLHVIDVKTGKEDFKIALDGQAGATAAVKGDLVYVGTMNNEVLAIDLKNRKVEWRYSAAKRQQAFYASAAVTDDLVVVGSRDRKVHAIDRKKGMLKWEFLTDGRVDSSPLVVGKRVFIGSLDKTFYILDLEKGEKLDSFDLDGGIASSPAIAEGKVVIGTDKGTIYCFGE